MSISSYGTVEASYPKGTETSGYLKTREMNGNEHVSYDITDCYSELVLEDLIKHFDRPLEEVEGLIVGARWECDEDGYFGCDLTLQDGKWQYFETEIQWVKHDLGDCPVELDYGLPSWRLREANRALHNLELVEFDERGRAVSARHIPGFGWCCEGRTKESVLSDIGKKYGVSMAYLEGKSDDPFGEDDDPKMKLGFKYLNKADHDFMDSKGYFAGGPCYDEQSEAKWGNVKVGDTTYTIICATAPEQDYWFCEDDQGFYTATAPHPDIAIAGWLTRALADEAWVEGDHGCEDAVNALAYWVFSLMVHGDRDAATHGKGPDFSDGVQHFLLDIIFGLAWPEIKRVAGDEWENF